MADLLVVPDRPGRWRRRLVRGFIGLGGVAAALLAATYASTGGLAAFGGTPRGARAVRLRASPHFAEGAFVNAEPTGMMKPGERWSTTRAFLFGNGEMRVPTCPLPMVEDVARRLATPPASGLRITWLGHSTVLVEIDGHTVLTDPMWSERASPSAWVGPRRFHPPPLPLDSLPRLDAVVISHDHYDHLDMNTIRALAARGVTFHVGLGVGAHLERWGVSPDHVVEHDWWESTRLPGGLDVVSTPGRHFSGRVVGGNPTLWTSWSLVGPRHRVFFSGDTGLTSQLRTIGERLGPFDVALLEIGQYHPSWGDIHLGPHGALEAHALLGARRLFPIHWSTFELGLHAWSEPAETLYAEAQKRGVQLVTPRLGEPVEPTAGVATPPWWRSLPPIATSCPGGDARASSAAPGL